MGGNATYGFILYYDLMSAVTARQYMDGQNVKGNNLRVSRGRICGESGESLSCVVSQRLVLIMLL